MDSEIKRILKLARIPGFILSDKDQTLLNEWKRQQEPVVPIKPKRTYKRKTKTTNQVKPEEKETGELEES